MALRLRPRLTRAAIVLVAALALPLTASAPATAATASKPRQSSTTQGHVIRGAKLATGSTRRCVTGSGKRGKHGSGRIRFSGSCPSAPSPETPSTTPQEPVPSPTPSEPAPEAGAQESAPAPSAPEAPSSPETSPAPSVTPAPSSIYWGAWLGRQLTGGEAPWDMSAVTKFEQMAGKKLSILQFGSPFANCYSSCYFYGFPTEPIQHIREHGSIPFLSWSSQSIPTETSEPNYQLADVARGDFDSYIRSYARSAAAWGHPFFLRFDWEMNGNWFPWGAAANGNSPSEFVAAWRHVHDIFTSVGATNATWVWCPNIDPDHDKVGLSSLYPGAEYVDWTCLDGYNWGTNPTLPQGWASFDRLFRSTYDEIVTKVAPGKPMIVGETGSSEYGGSKAAWIADMLSKIPTQYPSIRGLLYFERYDSNMDWPIETSAGATSAFASGIQNPAYTTNSFANLSASGPIAPPSS